MSKHIAVLMGGWSVEREVSLVSGQAVAECLRGLGYQVTEIDVDRSLAARLADTSPDLAFNALHGRWGEDGCVQGLLEMMGIPYTHSGVAASAMAMDKAVSRRLFAAAGIQCAEGTTARQADAVAGKVMAPPFVVKPLNEGSSVGVHMVMTDDELAASESLSGEAADQTVLVERYIPGREIQVALMGDRALGAIEIRAKGQFYDYDAKYTEGLAQHLMPAPLPEDAYAEALSLSLLAHNSLGCRGVTRADLRFDDTGSGQFYMLEINTQPGLTPLSLVPEIAAHHGISFADLIGWMVEDARCDA